MSLSPEQQTAQGRIHDLLQELADLTGPKIDGDDGENGENGPIGQCVLEHWVLVASWLDLDNDERYTTRTGSHALPAPLRTGLLHQALFQFND